MNSPACGGPLTCAGRQLDVRIRVSTGQPPTPIDRQKSIPGRRW